MAKKYFGTDGIRGAELIKAILMAICFLSLV